jgi:hypothetical protein
MLFPNIRAVIARQVFCSLSSRYPNQRKSVVALMAFLMSLSVITACVTLPSFELSAAKKSPAITETPRPKETATPHVVATVLTAELIGKLNIVDGCVRIIDRVDNVSSLLVWPPDFEVTIEKDTVRVIGGKVSGNHTEALLHDGEMVLFGGGEISQPNEQLLSSEPPNCPGPYWLVGSSGERYPAINEINP